ncbi:hypothetical protein RN001_004653 [Aquatica leii]|uniref:MADF domain-containing protein n=1 Tax=Aquatica leii TaxID=1421715 RepID=A0AAN7PBM8_9COLE|nr:hypothetical protein RN001_004653 [Aquatica leii]
MSWSREQVVVLIEEYMKYICLYAVKTKAYMNKHLRQHALENILDVTKSIKPSVTITDIKNKLNGLKATFLTEHRKLLQSHRSG